MAVVPIRVYLGGLFVYASLYKIAEPYDFALSVATYQILPLSIVNLFALLVPWIELGLGTALILGLWTRTAGLLASGLLLLFVVALSIALSRDLQLFCGCFASQQAAEEIGISTLFRDIAWLFLSFCVVVLDNGRYGLDRFLGQRERDRGTT